MTARRFQFARGNLLSCWLLLKALQKRAASATTLNGPVAGRSFVQITQNFLKHSTKWKIFTESHSTTLLLPSGCTSML